MPNCKDIPLLWSGFFWKVVNLGVCLTPLDVFMEIVEAKIKTLFIIFFWDL